MIRFRSRSRNGMLVASNSWSVASLAVPAGHTLTRAGTNATYFDATGLLKTAGANVARFGYNPATLALNGLMVEGAATNDLLQSRTLSTAPWVLSGTAGAQNATGVTGAANTAWTLTDASAAAFDGTYTAGVMTIANDSNAHAVSCFVLKDANSTAFPALRVFTSGGTGSTLDLVLNTSSGAFTAQQIAGTGGGNVENYGLWWKVTAYVNNNSTGNVSLNVVFFPAYTSGTTASAASVTPQRSCVVDQFDHRANSTVTDSAIITTAASSTRNADALTAATSGILAGTQGFTAMQVIPIIAPTSGNLIAATNLPMNINAGQLSLNDGTSARDFSALTLTVGTAVSLATTWGGVNCNGSIGGVLGTSRTFDGDMNLGATITVLGGVSAFLKSLRYGMTNLSDSSLRSMTQ